MKTNQQISVQLLAAVLLCGGLLACGDSADTSETQSTDTTASQTEAVTETSMWIDNLPEELDFNGEEVIIHTRYDGSDTAQGYMEVDQTEETGEVLSDAIYLRNRAIEDRLNVTITAYKGSGWQDYGTEMQRIRSSIAAGNNAWQAISGWSNSITSLSLENCFQNLLTLENLDLTQPWWNQSCVEGMQIGGGLYFATGDINFITMLGGSFVLFVNDRLADQYDIEDIPELVLDGKWTIDKMAEIVKSVKNDVNGDSVMDENDLWGLVIPFHNPANLFYTASDIHQIKLEDGIPVFVSAEEKVSALYDKIYPFFYGGASASSLNLDVDETKVAEMFISGQALMTSTTLGTTATKFREMDDDYTVLPSPKFDEAQDAYYTYAQNGICIYGIPTDNPNPETMAAVMEAMAAYNYNTLTETYFKVILQDKFARNDNSLRMLEIIKNCVNLDCEALYRDVLANTSKIMEQILANKNTGVASWYAKNTSKIEKTLEDTVEKLTALSE